MKLYHYWRSTSSWRVRWALEVKKIPCELIHVHLMTGEADSPEHLERHPAGYVPVLETDRGETLVESLAIINYLESLVPGLYPKDPIERAKALAFAEIVNSGIHPLQNPPVMAYYSSDPHRQVQWAQHWIAHGLKIYESLLPAAISDAEHPFSVGSDLSIADICLLPQMYNAERYGVDCNQFPKIRLIQAHLETLESFEKSHPDHYKPAEG